MLDMQQMALNYVAQFGFEMDGCIYVDLADNNGYPVKRFGDKTRKLCSAITGARAPLVSRHSCGNRACVNPDHLSVSTHKENHSDKVRHGTNQNGMQHYRHKFTDDQIRSIRADPRTQDEIAEQFGVQQSTISKIKLGLRWRHLL